MRAPLVVGVNGSDDALCAVDWAADEAALRGCPVQLLHASQWEQYGDAEMSGGPDPRLRRDAAARGLVAVAEARVASRRPEVAVSAVVQDEDPVYALVDASDRAAMVVVGSRGHGLSGVVAGAVSLTLAARAHCPVVVVRPGGGAGSAGGRWVLLGLGAPDRTPAAAEFAFVEAALRGCGVTVVHARPGRHGEHLAPGGGLSVGLPPLRRQMTEERLAEGLDGAVARCVTRHPGVPVRRLVVAGRAHPTLLRAAEGAELLVLGARRRADPLGPQLGPVNRAMLHHAPCTVAIVPVQPSGG
ncbi:universal stress protein [Streptomyces sp. NPDC057743]|uniref:universal stress protein n=1 Tax=Streptomyces sp. NPDC057743 TaxID=3346236 RepID=UPI00369EB884